MEDELSSECLFVCSDAEIKNNYLDVTFKVLSLVFTFRKLLFNDIKL